jgi:acetyl-CoA acetyltransferase
MVEVGERETFISGIGMSQVGRRLTRSGLDLTIEAAMRAIADAGLNPSDIDGLSTHHHFGFRTETGSPMTESVQDALGLNLNWYMSGHGHATMLGDCVINACLAISAGLARHVLVYRTLQESINTAGGFSWHDPDSEAEGDNAWLYPFGVTSPINWTALNCQLHFDRYGTKREQLAQLAINARNNAMLNPDAVVRQPITLDEYMSARMISTPLCLFDCDMPLDGSLCAVVSHVDYAPDAPKVPVHVNAVGAAFHGRPDWFQYEDFPHFGLEAAAKQMWARTSLTPADVDVAELYDGPSYFGLDGIEGMGFCKKGEVGEFLEGGKRIALDGDLPMSTDGGNLGAGRLHTMRFVLEAVTQLRHEGGRRQVKGAKVAKFWLSPPRRAG